MHSAAGGLSGLCRVSVVPGSLGHVSLGTVVLTGAAGLVGSVLREPLSAVADRLISVDRSPLSAQYVGEEVRTVDLNGLEEASRAIEGGEAVVHLAGVADEAPLPDLLSRGVLVAHHVLEASRRAGVRRVVLASSNRLTGCYPISQMVSPEMPPRPDGLYGVSKVAIEALGRLYADKFGLEVVCVRIGSLEHRPFESRHLATWLSPRDCQGFFLDALTSPTVAFSVVYAVSANPRRFWSLTSGYEPIDIADGLPEDFFGEDGPQGGDYAAPEYTLRYLV